MEQEKKDNQEQQIISIGGSDFENRLMESMTDIDINTPEDFVVSLFEPPEIPEETPDLVKEVLKDMYKKDLAEFLELIA